MNVLKELLKWSVDRPDWQRDALRRLMLNDELADNDITELTAICKSVHGLEDPVECVPLTEEHVPINDANGASIALASITHHYGVNALAQDQTLNFGPNLTIVYGDNGAGKTGYIRILKSACRSRRHEDILGNVVSGETPLNPSVSIMYTAGDDSKPREWSGDESDEEISRVSVFDTQCATVYLTQKTDVAFRPLGLDLFDKH